jgi:hypothetical protein
MSAMKMLHTRWVNRLPMAVLACMIAAGSTVTAHAQATIGLYELARFNLNSTSGTGNAEFIGSNPIAVGWNGSKLYVAGLNGSGTVAVNTSIVEITNAGSVVSAAIAAGGGGIVTPTYSSAFGTISSPASRGYTGLAMNGSQLAASLDLGSNSPNGIQMFSASTNTQSWNLTASGTTTGNIGTTRGYAGPDFDPGYQGVAGQGSGLAWVTQIQGRRFLNNATNGTSIYTTTTNIPTGAAQGMIINTNPVSTTWRDIGFDPATGNMYTRMQNGLTRTNRTGANTDADPNTSTAGQSAIVWTQGTAANNVASNLGYMNSVVSSTTGVFSNPYSGDLLVVNDRSSTGNGQSWTSVIQFVSTTGSSITPNWTFLSAPATGNAAYDFEWDQASQTLAVVDYANRNVSIFTTAVPEPSTYATLAAFAGIGFLIRRRRSIG